MPATAAAVATILATTHAAKWVLATPSAIATATAAALGGFGFRGNFAKHKDLAEALALEAVAFAVKADGYAGDMQSRVDRLVANQRAIVKGEPVSRKPVSKPA